MARAARRGAVPASRAVKRRQPKADGSGLLAGMMTLDADVPPVQPPLKPSNAGVPETRRLAVGSMQETNGAGSLENVAGFDAYVARNRGLFEPFAAPGIAVRGTDGFVLENVIGRDDRMPVGDTTRLPWRAIAMLTIRYRDGRRAMGTAWFLGPGALGTAGHNVLHPDHGPADEILVTPAYDGVVARFGSYLIRRTYCDPKWLAGEVRPELDYAVLFMDDASVGERLGWFGFASYDDSQLQRLLVNVSGYVVERSPQTQYFNGGRLGEVDDRFLLYDFDTSGGMSGSPIFALFGDKRVVVGIHTYGSDRRNRARRIDDELFDVLARFA